MKFIALQEKSAGNESVGSEWIETKSFDSTATLQEVWEWAMGQYHKTTNKHGRLMIQVDSASIEADGI